MADTTRFGIHVATLAEPANFPDAHNTAMGKLDTQGARYERGTLANLPPASAAKDGTFYFVDDGNYLMRCNGSTWLPVVEFPVGGIMLWAATTTPSGGGTWIEPQGQSILKSTYPLLFAAWGITASSTIVPDYRGRVPVAAGAGPSLTNRPLGQTGGEENHTLSIAELPAHSHRERLIDAALAGGNVGFTFEGSSTNADINPRYDAAYNEATGSGAGHNTMQPFIVARYLIRAA